MQEFPLAYRELLSARSLRAQAIALASIITLFVIIGPFGTYDSITPLGRFGYWGMTMGANWLVCGSVMVLALLVVRTRSQRHYLVTIVGAALLAAVPGTGVVFTAEALFRPGYANEASLLTIYLSVAVLMLAISHVVVTWITRQQRDPRKSGAAARGGLGADSTARFFDRLPPDLGRDLIYIKMADHYVEVFTTAGSTLVLMRFADAIAELSGADGMRVHRSYWVSCAHVAQTVRHGGRTILRLSNGHRVPVSRSHIADVRAAGLESSKT